MMTDNNDAQDDGPASAAAASNSPAEEQADATDSEPLKKRFRWNGDSALWDEKPTLRWVRGLDEVNPYSDIHVKLGDRIYQAHRNLLARDSEFFEKAASWPQKTASKIAVSTTTTAISNASGMREGQHKSVKASNGLTDLGSQGCNTNTSSNDTGSAATTRKVGAGVSSYSINAVVGGKSELGGVGLDANTKGNDNTNNSLGDVATCDVSDLLPPICLQNHVIFEEVLNFIYSRTQEQFVVRPGIAFFLFKSADVLGVKELFQRCATALEIYSSPYCLSLFEQGRTSCLPPTDPHLMDLEELCCSRIVEFFGPLTYTAERRAKILDLPFEIQGKILSDSELGVANEDLVVKYVSEYVKMNRTRNQAGGINDLVGSSAGGTNAVSVESLWDRVKWGQVSDEMLKQVSKEIPADDFVGTEVVMKHVLPELHNRMGRKCESETASESEANRRRQPIRRYQGPGIDMPPTAYPFYLDMVCPIEGAEGSDTDLIWGAVHNAVETARVQYRISKSGLKYWVDLPDEKSGIVSTAWLKEFDEKSRSDNRDDHWVFPEVSSPSFSLFFRYRVVVSPGKDDAGEWHHVMKRQLWYTIEITTPLAPGTTYKFPVDVSIGKRGNRNFPYGPKPNSKDTVVRDTPYHELDVFRGLPVDESSCAYFHDECPEDNPLSCEYVFSNGILTFEIDVGELRPV